MRTSLGCVLRLAPVVLLATATAGCVPNVAWLPDSSGFVYTGGKNKDSLYLYDLQKKGPRVLVEKGTGPAWPAVSPDGKRVAVALRSEDGERVSLEVVVVDCDGKVTHHSPKLDWAKSSGEQADGDKVASEVFWVPGQDRLLVECDGRTGTYDLETQKTMQWDVVLCACGPSPIRPDGKGFLAVKKGDGLDVVFMGWDGKQQTIEPAAKDTLEIPVHGKDPELGWAIFKGMILFAPMHASRRDGSIAVASWHDIQAQIDAEKFTLTTNRIKPSLSAEGKVIEEQVRLDGGGVVRAVERSARYQKDRPDDQPPFGSYRLEAVKQGAKEPKTLVDDVAFFTISPSPDGKHAAVRCFKTLDAILKTSKPDQDVLFLIDGLGDVADKIDLAK